jgi:trigger factor
MQPKMSLKGFRPGKVPAAHIKKMYGKSIMGDIVNDLVNESSTKALEEKSLRPASRPSIHLDVAADAVVAGEADLDYHMHVEVMPDFEPTDVSALTIERLVSEPTEDEINDSLKRLAENNKSYATKEGKAEKDDQVVIDFVGSIDGVKFDGGAAEDMPLVIGSGRFIPGFEDQLIGASAGDEVNVNVTFPEEYQVDTLKGKPALFEVKVKEVKGPKETEIGDEFAATLGLENLDALKGALKNQLSGDLNFATRQQVKRVLLDALDERHSFDLPPLMVKAEFEQIWAQFEQEKKADRLSDEDKGKSDEELKGEYQKIAERRVRLGLVLAEIGRTNNVQVTEQELNEAIRREAIKYGAQAQQIFNLLRENQNAQAQLRAPIFEDKVVDLIVSKAKVKDKKVSKDELMKEDDLPDGYTE